CSRMPTGCWYSIAAGSFQRGRLQPCAPILTCAESISGRQPSRERCPMLELRSLCAGYGRAQILFDVSLAVGDGEVLALLGRTGAGKSTTLKTIAGMVPAWRGEVRFSSERIERWPSYRIARAGVGYVPDTRRIFTELTVSENLEVGRREPRSRRAA